MALLFLVLTYVSTTAAAACTVYLLGSQEWLAGVSVFGLTLLSGWIFKRAIAAEAAA